MRTVELPELDEARALDDRPVPPFLRLTFEEALELFLERRVISPEDFRELSDEHRARAFTATRLASDALRQRAYDLLVSAIDSGSTVDDFVRQLNADEVSLGVTPSSRGYLENVFRTNIASSYGAGRYRQITSDVVRAARPYVQFRATVDGRVTDICRSLNGKVFSQEDPDWRRYAPPLHFQCRSVIIALREPPAGALTSSADVDVEPEPGFNAPPA